MRSHASTVLAPLISFYDKNTKTSSSYVKNDPKGLKRQLASKQRDLAKELIARTSGLSAEQQSSVLLSLIESTLRSYSFYKSTLPTTSKKADAFEKVLETINKKLPTSSAG